MILGAFWNDPQARVFPSWLKQQIVGGDPVMNGAKSIINFYLASVATISCLLSASIIFKNPLMWPFAIATIALGAFAIYEGTQR
jgi:cellulose synthase/poly-beta-1,6-N-acetylglucosamine synthase-like glycosyltransferase